ncbi:hypothetical protein Tco_1201644 [Tanacetum coccineum]
MTSGREDSPPLEANYEVLESLLRDHRRQVRNKDIRTELDYYSEEYDKEREMEPRPARVRKATQVLRTGYPRVRRHRGRVVEFKEAPNRDGSREIRRQEAFVMKSKIRWKSCRKPSSTARSSHGKKRERAASTVDLDLRIWRQSTFD